MDVLRVFLALVAGATTGALFAYLRVPVPAPPTVAGIMGIVGIYIGYRVVNALGVGFDIAALIP
jgi:XapX domain-containing protein